MHTSMLEYNAWYVRLRTKARKMDNKDIGKVLDNPTTVANAADRTTANEALFSIIVESVGNDDLINTIFERYDDDGHEALKYIRSCWTSTTLDSTMEATYDEYQKLHQQALPPGTTSNALSTIFNTMSTKRHAIKDTARNIPDNVHSNNMIDLVRRINSEYRMEVRLAISDINAVVNDPPKVAGILEGVMAAMAMQAPAPPPAQQPHIGVNAMLAELGGALGITPDEILTLVARRGGRPTTRDAAKCDECGIKHGGACYAKLLAEGKPVPKFDSLSSDAQERLQARAKDIRDKGPYKSRPKVLIASGVESKGGTICAFDEVRLHVDSCAGAGYPYHYIADRNLFVTLDTSKEPVAIMGIAQSTVASRGEGTCAFTVNGAHFVLTNCLFVPDLGYNLLGTDALWMNSRTQPILHGDKCLCLNDGRRIPLAADNTFVVKPKGEGPTKVNAFATFVTRGSGPTHVELKPMPKKDKAMFDLWSARLNDPAPARLRVAPNVLDGLPDILRYANANNTATDARRLANAPAFPARARDGPVALRPGQITQIDLCKMPCTSILGNNYLCSALDNYTSDFEFYPIRVKSDAPAAVNQWFLDSKVMGVDIDEGGTLYSDNEVVLNSIAMDEMAATHNNTRGNSNEYEPWGNGASESTFRIGVAEMRKMHVRSGVPQEFWDFSAIQAARILGITRERIANAMASHRAPYALGGVIRLLRSVCGGARSSRANHYHGVMAN